MGFIIMEPETRPHNRLHPISSHLSLHWHLPCTQTPLCSGAGRRHQIVPFPTVQGQRIHVRTSSFPQVTRHLKSGPSPSPHHPCGDTLSHPTSLPSSHNPTPNGRQITPPTPTLYPSLNPNGLKTFPQSRPYPRRHLPLPTLSHRQDHPPTARITPITLIQGSKLHLLPPSSQFLPIPQTRSGKPAIPNHPAAPNRNKAAGHAQLVRRQRQEIPTRFPPKNGKPAVHFEGRPPVSQTTGVTPPAGSSSRHGRASRSVRRARHGRSGRRRRASPRRRDSRAQPPATARCRSPRHG